MKKKKSILRALIALLLVVCIGSSLFPVASVKAQEENEETSVMETEASDAALPASDVLAPSETEHQVEDDQADETTLESDIAETENPTEDAANLSTFDGNSENPVAAEAEDASQAFTMKVTFDGQELDENTENAITNVWSDNSSKMMTVTITRNKNVNVDSNKQYVLCMKTSDVFYFNGLPDASKITGAEEVAMVKNNAPVVNLSGGASGALPGFSDYSGEIRMKLNTAVDTIEIPAVGVNYNLKLIGFAGGAQTISDPLQIRLISADKTTALEDITEGTESELHRVKVDSVTIQSGSLAGGSWKGAMSIDDFKTPVLTDSVVVGRNGAISYYFGTNGQEWQVYKNLEIQISCPYIEVEGEKYYLSFDENDQALRNNQKQNVQGYKMTKDAVYDSENHTITYTFENVYLGSHTALLYTPNFTWPSELSNISSISKNYVIQGVSLKVLEQKGYLGNDSTLKKEYKHSSSHEATFVPEGMNVKMASSYKSGNDVAKRYIYKDVTRENGIKGMLGFFDIHNESAEDTPLLDVKYQFNTEPTGGATYYVTQVNLAAYNNTEGTDVSFVLSNGKDEIQGTKSYTNQESFTCNVTDLRSACGADDTYYIQSLSYQTYLQKGTMYHKETAHLKRNRKEDYGTFFGYLEGELNTTASATMTISAADGVTPITADGKKQIDSTEVSTVSNEDSIGMRIDSVDVDGAASQLISAGSSTTLNITAIVSTEEYPLPGQLEVNGYHVLRNGIFYVCLPEDVSIAGAAQVTITSGGKNVTPEAPKRITEAFDVNGIKAYWWAIPVNELNAKGNQNVKASIELSTSESMASVVWNFSQCVGVRANGQTLTWGAASNKTSVYNTVDALNKSNNTAIMQLATYLETQGNIQNLGIAMLNQNESVKLNIARAEAKLDVTTALSTSESSDSNEAVSISNEDSTLTYGVTVACTEQGTANDFYYYIPIVHTDSVLDSDAWVTQKDIGLRLANAVTIKKIGDTDLNTTNLPFEICYTEEKNLNSATIRNSSVSWQKNVTDYTNVTAVRISTKTDAAVAQGETYQFTVTMKYDNSGKDFDRQAGSIAAWRSYGYYTYTRNGETTTNSYPSGNNSVKIRYVADMTGSPMTLTLNTAADTNHVDTSQDLPTTFANAQTLSIKKVTSSNGTQLISDNLEKLTGADANSKFRISFNINNSSSSMPLPSQGASWTVDANKAVTLQAMVYFSKALTDVTTERYVDIVLGNDDVDIICRVRLERTVASASADGSGLALGEQYQVPKVSAQCSISKDSAFTALYVVKNFVSGNYSNQLLKWQTTGGTDASFPTGTTITMMEVDENSQVISYWYDQPTGSSIDLNHFTRMAGNDKYKYDISSTSGTTLRYLFVVNFGQANAGIGAYQLVFDATAQNGAPAFSPVALPVTLGTTKDYSMSVTPTEDVQKPTANISYTVTAASDNDSYSEGRSLSLVLKPSKTTILPKDACIMYKENTYTCNNSGNFIIPLGTITGGSAQLTLVSALFPESEQTYTFDAKLYLSNSSHDETPMSGQSVATETVDFKKSATESPALKVTGTQIADQSEWSQGQDIYIQMKIPQNCTVTVTGYRGLTDNTKMTDLLSAVSGFDLKNGVGTYNRQKETTEKLTLNSTVKAGTYRLIFEVKNAEDKVLLSVPYYIVVK